MQDCGAMHHLLLSPMTWGLLWLAVAWWTWSRARTAWRALLVVAGVVILLLCTPLGANALIRWVESGVAPAQRCAAQDDAPIVVLSGGLEDEPRASDDYIALTPSSWRRVRSGVESWRRSPQALLVLAGGGPFETREATVLASLAREWGVPADRIRTETASTNTWESARALRGTLPPRVRVVSSATHLPRALIAFESAGFQPCAWTSDSAYVAPGSVGYFLPQLSAMQKTHLALYEMLGTLSYRWRSRD